MEVLREERALMMWPKRAVGGTLALRQSKLTWRTSKRATGPADLEIDLNAAAAAPAGRIIPWFFLLRGGIFILPVGIFSGWFRRCIAVQPAGQSEPYCFAVKDVDDWLMAIAREMPQR